VLSHCILTPVTSLPHDKLLINAVIEEFCSTSYLAGVVGVEARKAGFIKKKTFHN